MFATPRALILALLAASGCSHDWDAWLPPEGSTAGTTTTAPTPTGSCSPETDTPLKKVPAGSTAICIDETEVTRGQYMAWLQARLSTDPVLASPPGCAGTTLKVQGPWQEKTGSVADPDFPADWVDYCAAHGYCQAQGKHLCGAVGGGDIQFAQRNTASKSEWYAACGSGVNRKFPYGPKYDSGACFTEKENSAYSEVASLDTCVTQQGVYDMSGNVWEWESGCEKEECSIRGGGAAVIVPSSLDCPAEELDKIPKDARVYVGFRCCGTYTETN